MNYQLRMYYADAENQTAGPKATRDCSAILSEIGYRDFDVPVYRSRPALLNLLTLLKYSGKLLLKLRAGDTVLLQYPLLGINKWLSYFAELLRSRGCELICLVHDLDALRQVHHAWTLEEEVGRLNAFNRVIVHNGRMRALLEENGLKAEMRCLELFDYLLPEEVWSAMQVQVLDGEQNLKSEHDCSRLPYTRIAFAGSLRKSTFVEKLGQLQGLHFVIYGQGFEALQSVTMLEWAGSFNADELPAKLNADFGLVWDGENIDACTGYLGQYLKYNNPHKASLYLLAGLPLIAPTTSAIGAFINAHGIGITVDALTQLPEVLSRMQDVEYQTMKSAIQPIAGKIVSGAFLKQALATT
jgi:hypothetical protein